MSRSVAPGLMLFLCMTLPPAAVAGGWSVGSHLGISSIRGVGSGGSSTVVALANNALAYQPAFRIGYGNLERTREVTIDSGVFVVDEAGSTLSLVVGGANFQYVFSSTAFIAPFADVGVGLLNEAGSGRSSTTSTYGGGVGVRHVIRDQHGALRAEVRIDRLSPNDDVGRPQLDVVGFRLGFDLWL